MMVKSFPCAIGILIVLLAACQAAPDESIPVPTTANTNAVNTVVAASATAKAEPTATQPAPTGTPLPTVTATAVPTATPAPTSAPGDAPPWAGKLKRIPGATDPDGFVYEVPPEAMAGIEDWVRRLQVFIDETNASPEAVFLVTKEKLSEVVQEPVLSQALKGRRDARSLLKLDEEVALVKIVGLSINGTSAKVLYKKTTRSDAVEYERGTLKVLSRKNYPVVNRLATLVLSEHDGKWRAVSDTPSS